jgi:hypothetical protein
VHVCFSLGSERSDDRLKPECSTLKPGILFRCENWQKTRLFSNKGDFYAVREKEKKSEDSEAQA